MKKSFLILSAILLCMSAKAVELPAQYTPSNAGSLSIFSASGVALFDSLYVSTETSWQEYVRFYHTNVEQENTRTATQIAQATMGGTKVINKGISYEKADGTVATYDLNEDCLMTTGRVQRFSNTDSRWKAYITAGKNPSKMWSNLYLFQPSSDGLIKINPRTVSGRKYYGYHTIKIRHWYTLQDTRSCTRTQNWTVSYTNSGVRCKIGYRTFTASSVKNGSETQTYGSASEAFWRLDSVKVFFEGLSGATNTSGALTKPENTNRLTEVRTSARAALTASTSWSSIAAPAKPSVSDQCKDLLTSDWTESATTTSSGTQTRTKTGYWDDYVYVWICWTDDACTVMDKTYFSWKTGLANAFLVVRDGSDIDAADVQNATYGIAQWSGLDWPSTVTLPADTSDHIWRFTTNTNYDTIAQVRRQVHYATPMSVNMGLATTYEYTDTTWYDLSYSPSGYKYTSNQGGVWRKYNSPGTANTTASCNSGYTQGGYYHEWDAAYWNQSDPALREITIIRNTSNEQTYSITEVDNKTRGPGYAVYAKSGNVYNKKRLLWYKTSRLGAISNKKLYFTGTGTSLFYNGGDKLGFFQPNNCDIYLENVRMQTAKRDVIDWPWMKDTISVDDMSDYKSPNPPLKYYFPISASVFYLKDGDARIHIKGDNYLSGNTARIAWISLSIKLDLGSLLGTYYLDLDHGQPKCCAAIEIQDSMYYKSSSVPELTCSFDDVWGDGSHTNGYLDISTPSFGYSNQYIHGGSSTVSNQPDFTYEGDYGYWDGYRYASPLLTGGDHGTFQIDGGRINLWPANAHSAPIDREAAYDLGISVSMKTYGLPVSNYMTCGRMMWVLEMDSKLMNINLGSLSLPLLNKAITKILGARANFYGIGDGHAEGHFIVNGGTISANTDTKSFGYSYTTFNVTDPGEKYKEWTTDKKTVTKYSQNVADDGRGIPLFVPNPIINGGTFLWPVYGADESTIESDSTATWTNTMTGYTEGEYNCTESKSGEDMDVSRITMTMPAANTNYSSWNVDSDTINPTSELCSYIVNPNTAQEYIYGMQTVFSDANSKCYFYVPSSEVSFYKNYYVPAGCEITKFDGTALYPKPYNLIVDQGGIVSEESEFRPRGKAYYRQKFLDNGYYGICMPFQVTEVNDGYGAMNSYVSTTDNASADNSNAYFYLYHLDDGAGDAITTGVDDRFRRNYHTHTVGNYMEKGRPYVIKFPNTSTTNPTYWANTWVTFSSNNGAIVNGTNAYTPPTRPTQDTTFLMAGNPTFARQTSLLSGDYYFIDYKNNGTDAWLAYSHPSEFTAIEPASAYVLGSTNTMAIYRIIGREANTQTATTENTEQNNITTSLDGVEYNWTAFGTAGQIHIGAEKDAHIDIYTANGMHFASLSVEAGAMELLEAPTGIYLVRLGDTTTKVVVY